MSHELICEWLKLPDGAWPPDHYTLLGLPPGHLDLAQIEQQVHDRLETVRRYQLTHPEPATEAMNRLASAFVCLTDPAAKKAYDLDLLGDPMLPLDKEPGEAGETGEEPEPSVVLVATAPAPPAEPVADLPMPATFARPLAQTDIPAIRFQQGASPAPALPSVPLSTGAFPTVESSVAVPVLSATAVPAPQRVDPAVEAARRTPAARRGLGTRRALYQRLAQARQLARAWEQAGKYLAWPKRRVIRATDAAELNAVLTNLRTLLRGFPPLLGEAGQPGYLVVSLARQPVIVPMFQTLLTPQREALARDWWAGRTFLSSHRDFLRQELRSLRKKGLLGRGARAVIWFIMDEPGKLLLLLALLAINVAIWRTVFPNDWFVRASTSPPTEAAPPGDEPPVP
jgi:hypothetical protein